jgi:hypothetical protein
MTVAWKKIDFPHESFIKKPPVVPGQKTDVFNTQTTEDTNTHRTSRRELFRPEVEPTSLNISDINLVSLA